MQARCVLLPAVSVLRGLVKEEEEEEEEEEGEEEDEDEEDEDEEDDDDDEEEEEEGAPCSDEDTALQLPYTLALAFSNRMIVAAASRRSGARSISSIPTVGTILFSSKER